MNRLRAEAARTVRCLDDFDIFNYLTGYLVEHRRH